MALRYRWSHLPARVRDGHRQSPLEPGDDERRGLARRYLIFAYLAALFARLAASWSIRKQADAASRANRAGLLSLIATRSYLCPGSLRV